MDDIIGIENIFPSWKVKKIIGSGSYGKVYELERVEDDAVYRSAMKIITIPQNESEIKSRLAEGESRESVSAYYDDVTKNLLNENRVMAELKGNSNIVSYEDHQVVKHEDGIGSDIFIRMELLTSFIDYMAENNIDEDTVIRLGIDMCKALEICERRNLIHRDIKPGNIFVSDTGDFKLGDFGIARTIDMTSGGLSKKGTYRYMAPEVYKGDAYGRTVDICSLGLVMYYLMNDNRTPFLPYAPSPISYNDEEGALIKRMNGEVIPAPRHASGALASIILKACSYDPKDRYQSATQMREDLEALRSGTLRKEGAGRIGVKARPGAKARLGAKGKAGAKGRTGAAGAVTSTARTGETSGSGTTRPEATIPDTTARPASAGPVTPTAGPVAPAAGSVRPAPPPFRPAGGKNNRQLLIIGGAAAAAIIVGLVIFMLVSILSDRSGNEPAVIEETTTAQTETEATEAAATDELKEHVYAHRNGDGEARDINVFDQYDSFVSQGAEYIEQDICMYDGEPVLSFDPTYAAGKTRLRDVFNRYGRDVCYLVEIKQKDDVTINAVMNLIKEYGYEDRVMIQCFEKYPLRRVKEIQPDIETIYLIDAKHDAGNDLLNTLQDSYIDEISVCYEDGYMTEENCRRAHNSGKRFSAWTLKHEGAVIEAIEAGLDAYFTTIPGMAIQLEETHRDR